MIIQYESLQATPLLTHGHTFHRKLKNIVQRCFKFLSMKIPWFSKGAFPPRTFPEVQQPLEEFSSPTVLSSPPERSLLILSEGSETFRTGPAVLNIADWSSMLVFSTAFLHTQHF